jgi:hypothetical protein
VPYNPRPRRMYVACSSDGWSRNSDAERVLVIAWYRSSDQVFGSDSRREVYDWFGRPMIIQYCGRLDCEIRNLIFGFPTLRLPVFLPHVCQESLRSQPFQTEG